MILVFISAFTGSIGVIIDKIILTRRHLSVHIMAPMQFLFLFLITAIVVPWIGSFDLAQALTAKYLALFILMVLLAGIWNIFYYRAVKNESLQEIELIVLLAPLIISLVSAIFLPEERNLNVLLASIVASTVLFAAHIEKRHFVMDPFAKWLVVGIFVMALESIILKQLLYVWSPASLYLARTFYVFLFFQFLARPKFDHLGNKSVIWIMFSALVGVIFMITKFYGYQSLGIVYTTLVLGLQPSFTLIFDKLVLHERLRPKYIIAILVVIASVIYGTITR